MRLPAPADETVSQSNPAADEQAVKKPKPLPQTSQIASVGQVLTAVADAIGTGPGGAAGFLPIHN